MVERDATRTGLHTFGAGSPRLARRAVEIMAERGVIADARGARIRLCPDVLTTTDEIDLSAGVLVDALGSARL